MSNIPWIEWALETKLPNTILDLGAGAGKYGKLVKKVLPKSLVVGVEIWAPYVEEFNLNKIYDKVHICDARIYPDFNYDLVFLGDILEHMTKEEAVELWDKISRQAKTVILSIPIIKFPQKHEHGENPFEDHVKDNWTHEEVIASFLGITGYRTFKVTGIYIAEFKNDTRH
jgi:trans-aconitate methyltransferase